MDKVISELLQEVNKTGSFIKHLQNQLQEFSDSYSLQNASTDERTTAMMFVSLLDKLEDASDIIEFYKRPITKQGYLNQNSNGRYVVDGTELTCGSTVEILYDRWQEGKTEWLKTQIEAENGVYYAVGYQDALNGALARIRW